MIITPENYVRGFLLEAITNYRIMSIFLEFARATNVVGLYVYYANIDALEIVYYKMRNMCITVEFI